MKRIVDSMTSKHPAKVVGVSLKMYMDRAATVAWAREVKSLLASHPAVTSGVISVFALPSFPLIADVAEIFEGTKLVVGSQNLSHQDAGALTGEVSPVVLKQLGCQYAAIGHFERRTHFKENESEIAEKVSAAFRNQIAPIICVGETDFVLNQFKTCWGWELNKGQTTWMEVYDTHWSGCHQWSACPTWQLSRWILGVKPHFDLDIDTYSFDIRTGSLTQAEGRIPYHNHTGAMHIKWNKNGITTHVHIDTSEPITLHIKQDAETRIIRILGSTDFNI